MISWLFAVLYLPNCSKGTGGHCRKYHHPGVLMSNDKLDHHHASWMFGILQQDPRFEVRGVANGWENLKTGLGVGMGGGVFKEHIHTHSTIS